MAEFCEKCYTCRKSNSVAKWGRVMACFDEKCEYEPQPTLEELDAMTTVASNDN